MLILDQGFSLTDQVLDATKALADSTHDLEDEWAKVHGLVAGAARGAGEDRELSLAFNEGGAVHRVSPNA